jgi:chromosomal replication initiation ATPase DnaA
MDEEQIAEALKGQFFWEKTTKYAFDNSKEVTDIRRAQGKYREKTRYTKSPPRVDAETEHKVAALRDVVAGEFNITLENLDSRTTSKYSATPKNFLMWAACRYFTNLKLSQVGVCLNRHYSTVIHGRDTFEAEAHLHTDLIRRVDEKMGYR